MRDSKLMSCLPLIALLANCTSASMRLQLIASADVPACSSVLTEADSDRDGLADDCELQLARQFAPLLNVSSTACNSIEVGPSKRLGGGYRFAVQRVAADTIRVAFMPAYFLDCGWSGPKCALPGVDCAPHNGDSEFIVVDLVGPGDRPVVAGVFLSAHCFGATSGSCKWYRGAALGEFDWADGPTIWVAEGRNANYPSKRSCDRGHWWIDSCDGERTSYVFPVLSQGNIGSRSDPATAEGCIAASLVDPAVEYTYAGAVECFWSPHPFKGWQLTGEGVTSYSRYLREIAKM